MVSFVGVIDDWTLLFASLPSSAAKGVSLSSSRFVFDS